MIFLASFLGCVAGTFLGNMAATAWQIHRQKREIEAAGKRVSAALTQMQQEMGYVAPAVTRN
jgi:hypothetical protein